LNARESDIETVDAKVQNFPSESRPSLSTRLPLFRLTFALFVFFFFVCYTISYLKLVSALLARVPAIRAISEKFIPGFRNFIPGFSYTGFILPLIVAIAACAILVGVHGTSPHNLRIGIAANKFWLIAGALSIVAWYLTPGFASGGHTDFPFAVVASIYAGWNWESDRMRRSVLNCIVLGFGIGLVSDLQSQTFFVGIFGGWGFMDGDLLGTLLLPLAALTSVAVMRLSTGKTETNRKRGANLAERM
jgi:hypothetical protein